MSYKGQERRGFQTRRSEMQGLAVRIVREGIPLEQAELRKTENPKAVRMAVRKYINTLFGFDPTSNELIELLAHPALSAELKEETQKVLQELVKEIREKLNAFNQQLLGFEDESSDPEAVQNMIENTRNLLSDPNLGQPVHELYLGVKIENILLEKGIHLIGELVQKTDQELLAIYNVGQRTVDDIKTELGKMNLSLGMKMGKRNKRVLADIRSIMRTGRIVANS